MFTRQTQPRNAIVGVPGLSIDQKFRTPLVHSKATKWLICTVRGKIQITTLATAIKNGGSVLAFLPQLGVEEAGEPTYYGDARLLGTRSEVLRPSPATVKRLAAVAVGTYDLEEQIMIPFELPIGANPRETQYLEKEIEQAFDAYAMFSYDAARLLDGGAGVVSELSIDVDQIVDQDESELPYFKLKTEMISVQLAVAVEGLEIALSKGDALRSITIMQDTSGKGEVNDIITHFSLFGDFREYYGGKEGRVKFRNTAMAQEFEAGGNIFSRTNGCYLHVNFQEQGRLSRVLSPRQDKNLRLKIWGGPSQVAGAGVSSVRILVERLVRDTGVGSNGRRMVAADVPFPY